MTPSEFCEMFDAGETRMIGLPYGDKTDDMLSRFHLILERYGRTDRQICSINVSMLTRDKNGKVILNTYST